MLFQHSLISHDAFLEETGALIWKKIDHSKSVQFEPYLLRNYVIGTSLISQAAFLEARDAQIWQKVDHAKCVWLSYPLRNYVISISLIAYASYLTKKVEREMEI